jgi:hypothetical protein
VLPKFKYKYTMPNRRNVARSLGLELYHGPFLLFAAVKKVPFGDVIPRVSMEILRMDEEGKGSSAEVGNCTLYR